MLRIICFIDGLSVPLWENLVVTINIINIYKYVYDSYISFSVGVTTLDFTWLNYGPKST